MMLYLSLPPPDNQLASVGPAASAIMTPQPLFITVIVDLIYKRCTRGDTQREHSPDTVKPEEGAAENCVNSEMSRDDRGSGKSRDDRGSERNWVTFLSGGTGRSALVTVWERLTGVKQPDLVEEMLHQELIVPSPTPASDDKAGQWGESAWDTRGSGQRVTHESL